MTLIQPRDLLVAKRFKPSRFRPIYCSRPQLQAAEIRPAYLPGRTDVRWAGWIIGRRRFTPRQQRNIETKSYPWYKEDEA